MPQFYQCILMHLPAEIPALDCRAPALDVRASAPREHCRVAVSKQFGFLVSRASLRLRCWDGSSLAVACTPVGTCVTRTADSVRLTCWPPVLWRASSSHRTSSKSKRVSSTGSKMSILTDQFSACGRGETNCVDPLHGPSPGVRETLQLRSAGNRKLRWTGFGAEFGSHNPIPQPNSLPTSVGYRYPSTANAAPMGCLCRDADWANPRRAACWQRSSLLQLLHCRALDPVL